MSEAVEQFQVDLRGIVDLLSRHIYSGPRVYLRELLQNARDAIAARPDAADGSIRITPISARSDEFVLRDNGVGLSKAEVADLLATVGRSSKRDVFDLPRSDFLGQFGIGLLSCFMVADTIVVRSQSAAGGPPVEWEGRADGTFVVRTPSGAVPVGTSVHLRPRPGQTGLLGTRAVIEMAETFGEFLPVPVRVDLPGGGEETVTRTPPFLPGSTDTETLEYGRALLGQAPLDTIPLRVPGTETTGVAYVLPYAPPSGARQATRVYLGRMLLTERADDILPDWAFFARAVIDSNGLNPTASRESLVDDDALEDTRQHLGAAIRRWVLDLALTEPHRLSQFVAVHEVSLKSLVRHDDELAGFIVRWLSVETTQGRLRVSDLIERSPHVRYAETIDEYRQVASISDPSIPLVNGGYLYDAELIRLLPTLFETVTVERLDVTSEFDRLDPPPLDDRDAAIALEERATVALDEVGCRAVVRGLDPAELPAIYVASDEALRAIGRGRARNISGALWGGVIDRIDAVLDRSRAGDDDTTSVIHLCLNWRNSVVRALCGVADDEVFARTVHLLYAQALLAGQRPLTGRDRTLMTDALGGLVELSVRADLSDPQSAHRPTSTFTPKGPR